MCWWKNSLIQSPNFFLQNKISKFNYAWNRSLYFWHKLARVFFHLWGTNFVNSFRLVNQRTDEKISVSGCLVSFSCIIEFTWWQSSSFLNEIENDQPVGTTHGFSHFLYFIDRVSHAIFGIKVGKKKCLLRTNDDWTGRSFDRALLLLDVFRVRLRIFP